MLLLGKIEKSQDISKLKADRIKFSPNPKKRKLNSMSQKSAKRSSWVNAQDIKLPEIRQESSLLYVKSLYQYLFISLAFMKLRIFPLFSYQGN